MDQEKQIDIIESDIKTGMEPSAQSNPRVYKGLNYRDAAEFLYRVGYRRQSEWISVEERLPDEGEYVLIYADSIQIARIEKGITEEQREKMKNGELPDPEELRFAGSVGFKMIRRSSLYRSADVFGNNLVPYCWQVRGAPVELFGQRVSHWMPLPELPKMKGGE